MLARHAHRFAPFVVALVFSGAVHAAPLHASRLSAMSTDSSHVQLIWPAVTKATSYRISRGKLVLGSTTGLTFTDALLWPATSYAYTVTAVGSKGQTLSTVTASATTAALPSGGFPRPFAIASFWNTPIGPNPVVDPQNAKHMAYFDAHLNSPNMPLHAYGVSVAVSHATDATHNVPCTKYSCTLQAFGAFAIPVTATPAAGSDAHLAVVDSSGSREWDFWQAAHNGNTWSASAGAAVSTAGNGVAPAGTASGDAANLPLLGGIVRPEEILQGHIDHALAMSVPTIAAGPPVCPATHNAPIGTNSPDALREGMKLQLDPSVNVSSLSIPSWEKTIARALQVYGAYVRDNGGTVAVYAEDPASRGYDAWAKVGLTGTSVSLSGIPWTKLRVLAPSC